MGNTESIVDPEIRALTQLVSSFIQKRSSLNYQINQLKLAQNTKKTCIETKKLRDLKAKNSNLVVEIKNSEKILEKIKQKKFIYQKDKDLSKYVRNFEELLTKKRTNLISLEEVLAEESQYYKKKSEEEADRRNYCEHLKQKYSKNVEKISTASGLSIKFETISSAVNDLRIKHEIALEKKQKLSEQHMKLDQRRKLKRRQTLVIPKLPTNAFVLRSKLLLKSELIKQLNELKADQELHTEQQNKIKINIDLVKEDEKDFDTLKKLNNSKEFLQNKIYRYKSELELFQNSPVTPISAFLPLREIEDSLYTDLDSSESQAN